MFGNSPFGSVVVDRKMITEVASDIVDNVVASLSSLIDYGTSAAIISEKESVYIKPVGRMTRFVRFLTRKGNRTEDSERSRLS